MKTKFYFFLIIFIGIVNFSWSQNKTKKLSKPQTNFTIPAADSLFMAQKWEKAQQAYEIAFKQEKPNALAFNRLGFSYHNLGKWDDALKNYQKALENNPSQVLKPIILSRLARIYALKNEINKSLDFLSQATQVGYANLNELENEKELENVRKEEKFKEIIKQANLNAYPCLANAQARAFDFWLGEWDAYVTGTQNLAGHSSIQLASGGCMILENWTSVGAPYNGKSMNFIAPETGKWEQVWVGSAGNNPNNVGRFYNGEYREGAMRFDFEQTDNQGNKLKGRFIFFNQGENQVRQLNETSTDNGKTWTIVYDFTYIRKK